MTDEQRLEALGRIEHRLSQASEAAERLIAEAARARRPNRPPPAGWQTPPRGQTRRHAPELELLLTGARLLGDAAPPELFEHLAAALRELLLAIRALIDFYLERLERRGPGDEGIQDIPIE